MVHMQGTGHGPGILAPSLLLRLKFMTAELPKLMMPAAGK